MRNRIAGLVTVVLLVAGVAGIFSAAHGFEAREQLNINTARAEELAEVPGIDMELAKNIVAYRNENGPFARVDDLLKVKGMDEKILEKARMYLTIEAQTHLE